MQNKLVIINHPASCGTKAYQKTSKKIKTRMRKEFSTLHMRVMEQEAKS